MKKVYLIDYDLCSPYSCGRPCIQQCPITLTNMRRKAHQKKDEVPIRFKKSEQKMIIKSEFCIKCGICVNVCPRNAIYSMFLLDEPNDRPVIHQYNENRENPDQPGFKLYGLPNLAPGKVTGLCGPNGIGKSTVLNILSGDLIPNFQNQDLNSLSRAHWKELLQHVKESEMRDFFKGLYQENKKIAYKRQVLQILFEKFKGKTVKDILKQHKAIDDIVFNRILNALDIYAIANRNLNQCSGGELQRFAIAMVLIQDADCYLIDEPATFLDVKKRIQLAELLQDRAHGFVSESNQPQTKTKPVLIVEHDLAILDYASDIVHLFYGKPHEFGVLSRVQTTKSGINSYLNGFLKTENIQFRKKPIGFRRSVADRDWTNAQIVLEYPKLMKTFEDFKLEVSPGRLFRGEILGIVGENGTGKSTFAKLLVGQLKPDDETHFHGVKAYIAYKPQYIKRNINEKVQNFIASISQNYDFSPSMKQLLYEPLGVDKLLNKQVNQLSGGELQRVYICACLATRADFYVLDEPSAYLDVEERLHIASVIRSLTRHSHATTICIEHDIQIADALADRLLLFTGKPGKYGKTIGPLGKREGMNKFLQLLDITFRRDEETGRARINKKGSRLDRTQRAQGEYFYA